MNKILATLLLILVSCAPKEQISIFDSNMLIRTTEENEKITEEIVAINKQCEANRNYMEKSLKEHQKK